MKTNAFNRPKTPFSFFLSYKIVVLFFLFSNNLFSQMVGQGQLLDGATFEKAVLENRKDGKESYQDLYSNFHYLIDIDQQKIDMNALLKNIKSISGVIDVAFDVNSKEVIVVTQKVKGNPMESLLKQHIDLQGALIVNVSELIYKN